MTIPKHAKAFLRLPDGSLIDRDFSVMFDIATFSDDGLMQRYRRFPSGTVTWTVGGVTWAARYDAITPGADNIITPTYAEAPQIQEIRTEMPS